MDFAAVAPWVAATIAATSAFFSIWWPWHTRSQPLLSTERRFLSTSRLQLANLIVKCQLRRPTLLWTLRNDGDAPAQALKLEPTGDFDAWFVTFRSDDVELSAEHSILAPAEALTIVLVSRQAEPTTDPGLRVRWRERPIRLPRNHRSTTFKTGAPLPGKRPLERVERVLATHVLREQATEFGCSYEQFVTDVLEFDLDELRY